MCTENKTNANACKRIHDDLQTQKRCKRQQCQLNVRIRNTDLSIKTKTSTVFASNIRWRENNLVVHCLFAEKSKLTIYTDAKIKR